MPDADRNYCDRYADTDGATLSGVTLDATADGMAPHDFDDTLKLSHTVRFTGENLTIIGGSENAVDMNRECHDVLLEDCSLAGGGHCGLVIKGGCTHIFLNNLVFVDSEAPYEVELGGWSDQSKKRTTGVRMDNCRRDDGQPVRVVVGNSDFPKVVGGNVKVLYGRSLALKIFIFLKGLL